MCESYWILSEDRRISPLAYTHKIKALCRRNIVTFSLANQQLTRVVGSNISAHVSTSLYLHNCIINEEHEVAIYLPLSWDKNFSNSFSD